MKNKILTLTGAVTAAGIFATAVASPALACAPNYKPVKIQGNWVCMFDHGGPTSLASPDKRPVYKAAKIQKLKLQRK
ncbi:MAG: hypothetical protein KDJ45_06210 [Hyphomicrobiaceae bacterium]|nr:hypothetical protein [Hyphomicrobiaceae bacterium]MCC0010419.1 hypothetical protein [Hyphomicrobiaceae bacterium]